MATLEKPSLVPVAAATSITQADIMRACAVQQSHPPENTRQLGNDILCAMLFGVGVAVAITFLYWQILWELLA